MTQEGEEKMERGDTDASCMFRPTLAHTHREREEGRARGGGSMCGCSTQGGISREKGTRIKKKVSEATL